MEKYLKYLVSSKKYVEDFHGFNFIKMDEVKEGTIFKFECLRGIGLCLLEDPKYRFKHARAILL